MTPEQLTDRELYKKCQEYGLNAKQWLRKFAGLLPEVARRRLYKRRGYTSIHEFAAKLAGMSESAVDRVLRLHKKFEDKPHLKEQLESGSVGWTKLETIAYVATRVDEREWAMRAKELTQGALEVFVKNFRLKSPVDGTFSGQNRNASMRERFSFEVSSKTAFKFRKLKQQFEKEKGEAMSFEQALEVILRRAEKDENAAESVVERCPDCVARREQAREKDHEVKRAIPVAVQQVVRARQNSRCAFPNCSKPMTSFHHTRRFALVKSHDPTFIAGLCTAHERLAHASLIENEEKSPEHWRIREAAAPWWDLKTAVDQTVNAFRREPAPTCARMAAPCP